VMFIYVTAVDTVTIHRSSFKTNLARTTEATKR
jgi:hypothetical protein